MDKQVEKIISEMESKNILMSQEMTFVEYTDELLKFQEMIIRMIMGNDFEEGMRLDEVIYYMEAKARKKGIQNNETIRKGISALRTVNKEISISLAGKRGENLVARTLEFVERPNTEMYRNVYVMDEERETELDNVILTDSGIIILEVKKSKDDIIISPEGRLLHSDYACYDKIPLGEKMYQKRFLLKRAIENRLAEKDLSFPICIESFIVFTAPQGMRINVEDQYRREKWCYRTGLVNKINNYVGRAYYSKSQLEQLNEILREIELQVKRFSLSINYTEVRRNLAEALVLLADEPMKRNCEDNIRESISSKESTKKMFNNKLQGKTVAFVASAFVGAVSLGTVIGLSVLGNRKAS